MSASDANAPVVGCDVVEELFLPGVGFNAQHLFHEQHRVVSVELRKSNKWVFTHFFKFFVVNVGSLWVVC
jgi:hypothetical protein